MSENHLKLKAKNMTALMHESMRVQPRSGRKLTAHALSDIGISLADIDWRLLHWLLRYPLQRADDLVVGVARWASRATVYRHVQALEASGLVESVLPKTPGTGKRLYHLSNPGLHLLARHLGRPVRELARKWQADEAGLLRLLPRLPTLLVLQDVINGLITHASDAMTSQGHRPELVRWTWQRDVTHQFLYRERSMRFFADGILAFLIRSQQSRGNVQERWFGVVLLSTMLDDERLMRLRLERLMCWRESPERWSCYQHMLPVLILARSLRQRDHWQSAVKASALKLRLDPLVGALVCVPPTEGTQVNPWMLNWRTLTTGVSCHLQDVLKPLSREAFPSSLPLEESEYEQEHHARLQSNDAPLVVTSGASARLSRLIVGELTKRAAQATKAGLEEREVVSLLGLSLTPCQWSIVRLLLAHPLLSDEELAAFLGLQRRSVRCSLYDLHQLGCLEAISTKVGKRWRLAGRGLRLIAAAQHLHIRNIADIHEEKTDGGTSIVRQRGEAWLLQHMQHTAGIYGFFASLTDSARRSPGHELCWWETGSMCERRYRVGEQWYNLRPDAMASYRTGQQYMRFWLEWDRGTMNVRDLAVKFASYAFYIASREWAREGSMLPVLVCVAPEIAQEKRLAHVVRARSAQADGFVVWTTTEVLLNSYGPLAPIWLRTIPTLSQVEQPGIGQRQILFAVDLQHKPEGD
jgi:predicted transcriptional regulator